MTHLSRKDPNKAREQNQEACHGVAGQAVDFG